MHKRRRTNNITKSERTGMLMKQKITKKLLMITFIIGILVFAGVPAEAAGKKEVWVVDSKTSEFDKYKYTYNKKGLLVKDTCVKSNGGIPSYEYVYSGTKISKEIGMLNGEKYYETQYTYNKKGYLIKETAPGFADDYVEKYEWKNGCCVKAPGVSLSYDKNGWITKIDDGNGPARIMAYDKQGYMLTDGEEGRDAMEGRANTYKNGRLVRQAAVDENGEEYAGAYTYKYKKITVPASAVKKVKKQQEWLTDKGGLHFLPLAAF